VVDRDAGYDDQQREKPASQKSRRKHDSRWVLAARSVISRNEKTPHCEFRTGGTRYVQRTRDRSKGCVSKLAIRGRGAFQAPVAGWAPAGGWKPPLLQHPAASFDSGDTPRPKKRTRDRSKNVQGTGPRKGCVSELTPRVGGRFEGGAPSRRPWRAGRPPAAGSRRSFSPQQGSVISELRPRV
jgi:hypothetical protein